MIYHIDKYIILITHSINIYYLFLLIQCFLLLIICELSTLFLLDTTLREDVVFFNDEW